MPAHSVIHPSPDSLRAFGLGKMDATSAGVVIDHLDQCPECRKVVASLSGDGFLERIRQAHDQNATPAPAKPLSPIPRDPKPAPSTPKSSPPLPDLPPELASHPQYEILRELGRGGMGVVYLAKNKLMDRLEVLKVVNKALLDRPSAVERFLREIRSAAKLSHANVVGAYSALQVGDLLAFAMEYVEGEDLAVVVDKQGPLPIAHACYYVQQAALGLQHACEKGMIHRDIKPQNLILARVGKTHVVKVLDFGLAKVAREKAEDTGLTGAGKMMGTPDYMAPEQSVDAASADIRADIYSLGCTLYHLLTGDPPFKGGSLYAILHAHQSVGATPLNVVRPEVPEALAAVVAKMIAKEPDKRYQKPIEVVQALAGFVKPDAKKVPPKPAPDRPARGTEVPVAPPLAQVVRKASATQVPDADLWNTVTKASNAPTVLPDSGAIRQRRLPVAQPTARKQWLIGGGVGVGVLLLALLGLWAGGVFKVKTKDGTIVLENVPDDADVIVDGETVTLRDWEGKEVTIRVAAGRKHQVQVKREGFKVFGQEVEIDAGKRRAIVVRLEPKLAATAAPAAGGVPAKPAPAVVAKDVVPAKPAPVATPENVVPAKPAPAVVAKDVVPAKPGVVAEGFVSLFNGKDLTGWKTHLRQPGRWHVENNVLIGSGPARSYLYTERGDYKDFHLRVEARINDRGNGGLHFRTPFGPTIPVNNPSFLAGYEAQINSTHGDANKTGSLYGVVPVVSVRQSPVPPGEWFTMEVIAEGNHLVIKVNGKTMTDYTDAKRSFTRGHVALEQHDATSKAEFRKIEIKELPPTNPDDRGFVPLFNGKDLTGWKTHPLQPGGWAVENGCLVGRSLVRNHLFSTGGDYKDFHLRAEARINKFGNSGILFRSTFGLDRDGLFPAAYEAQILHSYPKPNVPLTGSLFRFQPVLKPLVKPNDWFTLEILARGNRIVIKVNSEVTVDFVDKDNTYRRGHVVLQAMSNNVVAATTVVRFRKIEIKELNAEQPNEK